MNDSNKKEQFYKNLVGLFKNFTGRNLHLVKFLIENKAFNEDFIEKVIKNDKLSEMDEAESSAVVKALYFVDISHMTDYFNSLLDDKSDIDTKRDMTKELNDKLDKFIRDEKYEDAIRVRDYMVKNNIERRGEN
jgi:hypothetical protein